MPVPDNQLGSPLPTPLPAALFQPGRNPGLPLSALSARVVSIRSPSPSRQREVPTRDSGSLESGPEGDGEGSLRFGFGEPSSWNLEAIEVRTAPRHHSLSDA
eukprot:545844-Rhodomonas_salina.1